MKTTLHGKVHSIGKTDDRNDDFALWIPILNSRVLGVLGDFTSDSPPGVNHALCEDLEKEIQDRLETWRLHLISERNIINLVVRFVNKWLNDYREKAKTTLIVVVYDIYQKPMLHYACIGDSGLAVAANGKVEFLVKGDTTGMRDAAGFLPLNADDFNIKKAHLPTHSVVFAYTDGLWEAAGHVLAKDPATQLAKIFHYDRMANISSRITALTDQSTRKDDLTILYLKDIAVTDNTDMASTIVPSAEIHDYLTDLTTKIDALIDRAKPLSNSN